MNDERKFLLLISSLAIGLLIGLLIGLERGWLASHAQRTTACRELWFPMLIMTLAILLSGLLV